jgi:hypothetical protein
MGTTVDDPYDSLLSGEDERGPLLRQSQTSSAAPLISPFVHIPQSLNKTREETLIYSYLDFKLLFALMMSMLVIPVVLSLLDSHLNPNFVQRTKGKKRGYVFLLLMSLFQLLFCAVAIFSSIIICVRK